MEDVKNRILDGATQCFIKYGYQKTTMEDIGRTVNLKKNSLYYYFKNKEEIFFEVIGCELKTANDQYRAGSDSIEDATGKIREYFSQKLVSCKEESVLNSVLAEIMVPGNHLYNRVLNMLYLNEIEYIESILWEAYDNKEIGKNDFRLFSESLSLLYDAVKFGEMKSPDNKYRLDLPRDNDQYIMFIIETMLNGISTK